MSASSTEDDGDDEGDGASTCRVKGGKPTTKVELEVLHASIEVDIKHANAQLDAQPKCPRYLGWLEGLKNSKWTASSERGDAAGSKWTASSK